MIVKYQTARDAAKAIYDFIDPRTYSVFPREVGNPFQLSHEDHYEALWDFVMVKFDVNLRDVFCRSRSDRWSVEVHKGSFEDFVMAVLLHAEYIKLPTIKAKAIVLENSDRPSIHDYMELANDVPDEAIGEMIGDLLRAAYKDGLRIRNGLTLVITLKENEIDWDE